MRVPHPRHHPPPPPSSAHETSNDEVKPASTSTSNNETKQNETEEVNETKQNDTKLETDSSEQVTVTKTRSLSTQFVEEYLHSNEEHNANEDSLDMDPLINVKTDAVRTADQEQVQQSGDDEEEVNPLDIDNLYEPPERDKDKKERGTVMYSSPSKKKE